MKNKNLKIWMKQTGIKQKALAKFMGKSENFICKALKNGFVKIDHIKKLEEITGLTFLELLDRSS